MEGLKTITREELKEKMDRGRDAGRPGADGHGLRERLRVRGRQAGLDRGRLSHRERRQFTPRRGSPVTSYSGLRDS
jgi:hypothetical protein